MINEVMCSPEQCFAERERFLAKDGQYVVKRVERTLLRDACIKYHKEMGYESTYDAAIGWEKKYGGYTPYLLVFLHFIERERPKEEPT